MTYDRSNVDLTNCDREPIHIPGSIQPHGAIIVIDDESGLVSFVSQNIDQFLGDTNRDYVGSKLSDVIGSAAAHDIANAVARAGTGHVAAVVLRAELEGGEEIADITAHRYEGRTFVSWNIRPLQSTPRWLCILRRLWSGASKTTSRSSGSSRL